MSQVQLYEDFARSRAQKQVEEEIGAESTEHEDMETTPTGGRKDKKQPGETHIFQVSTNWSVKIFEFFICIINFISLFL